MTTSRRLLLLPALAVLCGLPVMARAHAVLLDSSPVAGGRVKAGPVALRLRFNSRIDIARSRFILLRPGVPDLVLEAQAPADNVATATASLTPGRYTLRWQVLAVDGHITRGDLPFAVSGD